MTSALPADAAGMALREARVDHPHAARLLRAFRDEQVARYGFADPVDLDPHTYSPPNGTFVIAYQGGRPVGCAGCRWYDRSIGVVEVRKTYLIAEARGRGLGRALLHRLESHAVGWGARRVILETGVRNTAALALFAASGYQPTAQYVPGRDPTINRAFVKPLTPAPQPPDAPATRTTTR
ncbi:GNAT family N-acetyltransferase [Salinispora cortesiana]|uniref:GNAT family N-acetyltransferase n=1 Tax=Salinispora cortesiana TaxID=1305843 RepID=UPI001FDED1B0|nr:GNAT family N-acetyltransferase [Salinispora cortesiana]